jgi:hypothetical protein
MTYWETFFPRCKKAPIHAHLLELSILGTPDFRNCKSLPLKAGFGYAQVYFKTGFPVFFRVQRKGYIYT